MSKARRPLFLIAMATLVVPVGAAAATGRGQMPLGPGQTGTARAQCPAGTHAVAGGFAGAFNPDFLTGPEVLTFESRPVHGDWRVRGQNVSVGTGVLDATAYCRKDLPVDVAHSETTIPASNGTTFPTANDLVAQCPAGEQVVAGGFDVPNFGSDVATDPQVFPYTSERASRSSWLVQAISQGAAPATVDAYAVCTPRAIHLSMSTAGRHVPRFQGSAVPNRSATAQCGSGKGVFSGGFVTTSGEGPTQNHSPFLRFSASVRRSGGWFVRANNVGGASGDFVAIAYCH
jgi:hypothetical protein